MSLFTMDSIYAIGLGLGLRFVVDTASHHNERLGGSLVGLWEGAVLYHFLEKWPTSFDPYVSFGVRLFVDFLFTESLARLTIVLLWAGLGMIISDVTPAFWYDRSLRRFVRRTRRYVKHFRLSSIKFPISPTSISRVRFTTTPRTLTGAASTSNGSSNTSVFTAPILRRRVPGQFPGYTSESSATSIRPRRPIPASSLPPSIPRTAATTSASGSNSTSKLDTLDGFEIIPPAAEIPSIEDLYEDSPRTPTTTSAALPVPAPSMPVPEVYEHPLPPLPAPALGLAPQPQPEIHETQPSMDDMPEIQVQEDLVANARPREAEPPAYEEVEVSEKPEKSAEPGSSLDRHSEAGDTVRSSIISGGNRNSILLRADVLRDQAQSEEAERDRIGKERKKALLERRYTDALRHKVEYEEAHERAMNLHKRAARRYFQAHNLSAEPHTIDVHRLKVPEAIRRTEIALRDTLVEGGTQLRVITGRGNHSVGKIPVLKLAIVREMTEQHRLTTEVDPSNPGVVVIRLPSS
ncbi:hypothetical protein DENSPDRAFT_837918 [Dentipellis sp. KUC8613]|nr:hypothetical protein DENSPDRAFT_837918 [Dentipellis sp. KUC8613]